MGFPKALLVMLSSIITSAHTLHAEGAPEADAILHQKSVWRAANEIHLQSFQKEQVQADFPVMDARILGGNEFWFIGQHSLWIMQPENKGLRKISLLNEAALREGEGSDTLRSIHADAGGTFIASDRLLYQFSSARQQVFRYQFPGLEKKSGKTIALVAGSDYVWWIHEAGVARIDRFGRKLSIIGRDSRIAQLSYPGVSSAGDELWAISGKEIVHFTVDKGRLAGPKVIAKLGSEVRSAAMFGKEYMVATPFTVLRYDNHGKVVQALPVEGKRRLVLAEFQDGLHSYLFNDRLLEIFDLRNESSLHTRLDLGRVKRAQKLIATKDIVAVLGDGALHFFGLQSTLEHGNPVARGIPKKGDDKG